MSDHYNQEPLSNDDAKSIAHMFNETKHGLGEIDASLMESNNKVNAQKLDSNKVFAIPPEQAAEVARKKYEAQAKLAYEAQHPPQPPMNQAPVHPQGPPPEIAPHPSVLMIPEPDAQPVADGNPYARNSAPPPPAPPVQYPPATHEYPVYPPQPQVAYTQQPVATAPVPVNPVAEKKEITAIKKKLKKVEEELKALKEIKNFKYSNVKYAIKTDSFEGTSNNSVYLIDILLKELQKNPKSIAITKV